MSSDAPAPPRSRPLLHLALFGLTLWSLLVTGAMYDGRVPEEPSILGLALSAGGGLRFAVPLILILLVHEFGHYFAARIHRVAASLPYFLPAPLLSPFGTFGAVIVMPERIRSRNALLDIGAAGPIAGLVVAIPTVIVGLMTSEVSPLPPSYQQEGQSLLYWLLKRVCLGPIPEGSDVMMNATAFAGWTGLFVTALNLIPVGQLDGGHIAYALFGPRWDRMAPWVQRSLLLVFAYNLLIFVVPVLTHGGSLGAAIGNSTFWLVWFGLLSLMRWRTGENHPVTDAGELSPARRGVAIGCLLLFVLLFMPTPWASYGYG